MKANEFAKEACEKGVCVSRAEGRRLFHHLKNKKPTMCPCPICFQCCCHLLEGLEDFGQQCTNTKICTYYE